MSIDSGSIKNGAAFACDAACPTIDAIEKVVVSDGLTDDDLGPWTHTTRIVRRADAHEAIAELKRGPGREILVFGSHVLWNDLLIAGLVDELHLMIGSAFLGDGVPVFTGRRADLRLLDVRQLGDSQLVLTRYAASGTATA